MIRYRRVNNQRKSQLAPGNGAGAIYARVKSTSRRQPDGRVTPRSRWCEGENVRSCEVQAVEQEGGEGLRKGVRMGTDASSDEYASERTSAQPLNQQNVNLFLVAVQPVNTVTRNFCRRN